MIVSVLIISYNTRELTLECLRSVYDQTKDLMFETIVVDNDSSDGSAEAIEQQFPQVTLIKAGKNFGFAAANNLAARQARGDFLLLLNPDTVILDRAIERAISFSKSLAGNAIVGGRTYFADGRLNRSSCHGFPTLWSMFCVGIGLSSLFRQSRIFDPESLGSWRRDTVRVVDAITGCFLMLPRTLWNDLNGFDETFFMYAEETDFCLRARMLGVKCYVCPDARLIHHGGASDRVRADKMLKLFAAKAHFVRKHWHPASAWFGIRMLDLWAFTRSVGLGTLRLAIPRKSEAFRSWREVWSRRREYQLNGSVKQTLPQENQGIAPAH